MTTYAQAVDDWADSRITLETVQPYTAKKSAEKARLFVPFIGNQDVDEISPCDIEQAIIVLKRGGGRRGQGLSSTTLRAAHLGGTQAVDWAIAHGMAHENPFKLVERPKAAKTVARSLDEAQAGQLALFTRQTLEESMNADDLKRTSFCVAVLLAIGTGMRRGEIFGLEWTDYDGLTLSIKRSLKPDKRIGEPKTQAGVRRVSIGANIAQLLDSFKAWQSPKIPVRKWNDPAPVMSNATGERLSMDAFEHWWAKFRDDAGFCGLKFHELRHTHASLLIASGTDVKTVQGRLGHSSADITMNIYAHALPRNDVQAAQSIDKLFGGAR